MTMQVADVNKVLASVKRICDAGNRVVFDKNGGKIIDTATGKVTELEEKNGTYVFNMWLPRVKERGSIESVNRFAALAEEQGNDEVF